MCIRPAMPHAPAHKCMRMHLDERSSVNSNCWWCKGSGLGRLEYRDGMIGGDHGLIETLRGIVGIDRYGLLGVKGAGEINFFCFLFGDHERSAGMVFFCVAHHLLFAIAMGGSSHDATMPIADHLPVLKSDKSDKAYRGDEFSHADAVYSIRKLANNCGKG